MKLLHIPVLLCSCIRAALYNIEKDLRFVQDQAGHGTNSPLYAKTNNKAHKRRVQALDEEEF